jgi:cell division GTPase FtsZ
MGEEIRITVIATGFDSSSAHARSSRSRFSQVISQSNGESKNIKNEENATTRNLAEFGTQIYNTDEIEVPAFLRNRNQ